MHKLGKPRLNTLGNEISGAANKLSRIRGILILGVVHYSLGNQYNIPGLQMIYFVFNKITAGALSDKIYLKMAMTMLAHRVSTDSLDIAVSIVEELALSVNVFIIHKTT
jgi:hypothetical protein